MLKILNSHQTLPVANLGSEPGVSKDADFKSRKQLTTAETVDYGSSITTDGR